MTCRWKFLLLALPFSLGCNASIIGASNDGAATMGADGAVDQDGFLAGGITVSPAETTVDVTVGGAPATAPFTATAVGPGGMQDVTGMALWQVDDPTLGTIANGANGLFSAAGMKGGTTTVRAQWMGLTGAAIVHVRLHAKEGTCVNCPKFPDLPGKACGAGSAPSVVYPPSGVLLPPNMNVMAVQFTPGAGNAFYEVDFESGQTDVRVATVCNPITDTRGQPTGGCSYDLDQTVWDFVSNGNRGGPPVVVTVRGTKDGTCATPSPPVAISFAEEDLKGGLYYWQSLVVGGIPGKSGGIYRYDFGVRNAVGEPFLTPAQGSCVGCHFLSRDGRRMTYGTDDADSDDEYGDLQAHLLDVGAKAVIPTTSPNGPMGKGGKALPPGFQTFSHDHLHLLATLGQTAMATSFLEYDGDKGGAVAGMAATGPARATQPDWSADDKQVVFVAPDHFADQFMPNPYKRSDDDHFVGGSLLTMPWDALAGFGAPKTLVKSQGENNYYPSFSPDTPASFVVFNRADLGEMGSDLQKDAFNNPNAEVWVLSLKPGASPIAASRANGPGLTTNSWPRWSPFVQKYQGNRLLWVTFSSTRDYGLKVRNQVQVTANGQLTDQVNCYPPDSPQNLNGSHQQPLPENCHQPQIWMAAINLSQAEFGGMDPSFPAFWLPFQEVGAHNHIAQWTEEVVRTPGCDGGACIAVNQPCGGGGQCGVCCEGLVCSGGSCSNPIP